jgi:hypothetical protein
MKTPVGLAWKSDRELFALLRRELYSPVVGDILEADIGCYRLD